MYRESLFEYAHSGLVFSLYIYIYRVYLSMYTVVLCSRSYIYGRNKYYRGLTFDECTCSSYLTNSIIYKCVTLRYVVTITY